jgi:glc operon protein GlcG
MRNMIVAAAAAVLLLSSVVVQAQTAAPAAPAPAPPAPYGLSIGFDAAKKAIAAAEAEAKKNNWAVAIAIVDTGGNLVAFSRIDNTQNASVEIAIGKASTSVDFKRPTKALQDAIAQGGANLRLLAVKSATPLEGGVPIVVDGKIIGGIGVSGVTSAQDAEVAMAGANAAK